MKRQRVAVVRHGNSYVFCREAIGGGYYNPVARFADKGQINSLVEGPQDGQIIVYFARGEWGVTSKQPDADNAKPVVFNCKTRLAAEGMIK